MIPEGCCPNSATGLNCLHVELTLAREGVADQFPSDQVEAMVNGSAGEILKSRSGTELIFADSDDGRVRVESLDNRVSYDGHLSVSALVGIPTSTRQKLISGFVVF